jgi:2-keto-4-pentenoate hydratase/2-oxohepta-3-ene-1,7-dioic acid hydratase in catechol pathway
MRFANHEGRLTLLGGGSEDERDGATGIDLHAASGGRISAEPLALQAWVEVLAAARELTGADQIAIDPTRLQSPAPHPRQIFGIGVNYIGAPARQVPEAQAWDVVAGLTVVQDLSDRDIQWRPTSSPQFSWASHWPGLRRWAQSS